MNIIARNLVYSQNESSIPLSFVILLFFLVETIDENLSFIAPHFLVECRLLPSLAVKLFGFMTWPSL